LAPAEEIPVVCFELAGELYAADVDHVREIIRPQEVSPVPRAPAFIEGMTNLRGKVVPVVNFRRLMGFPPQEQTKRTRVLIVEFNHQLVGAVVDGVSQVTRLSTEAIEPPSHIVTRIDTAYLKGVAPIGPQLAIVLDLDRVLDDAQEKALLTLNARQEQS
jgi:purine-binding chemotaxis protein CheW